MSSVYLSKHTNMKDNIDQIQRIIQFILRKYTQHYKYLFKSK